MKTNVIHHQDCFEGMKDLPENSVDAIVTDPPYGLSFMGAEWDDFSDNEALQEWTKRWASEALRVLKPGGHLLSFGGTRTYHRIASGLEDAGFEIRDQVQWIYGSGFPKSHNIGKAVDKKMFQNWLDENPEIKEQYKKERKNADGANELQEIKDKYKKKSGLERERLRENPNSRTNDPDKDVYDAGIRGKQTYITAPATDKAEKWEGWGTALKPANEPIALARAPLSEDTIAENVLRWGTGGLNIDECRVNGKMDGCWGGSQKSSIGYHGTEVTEYETEEHDQGRFPANLIHDGSDEATQYMTWKGKSKQRYFYSPKANKSERNAGLEGFEEKDKKRFGSGGRTKIDGEWVETHSERKPFKNDHPTVKPIALMQYLCRLVTPPEGTVLDPFIGSGTTGIAAVKEGFDYIGFEKEQEYVEIARARIEHWANEVEKEQQQELI